MSAVTVSTHDTNTEAQQMRSECIKFQRLWDRAWSQMTGTQPEPPPEDIYRVEKDGRRFLVIWDDPSLRAAPNTE